MTTSLVCLFALACLAASALSLQVEFPPLKYSYSEYEPLVDADTMRIHHGGHFKQYTDNLNAALLDAQRYAPGIATLSLVGVLQSIQSRDETHGMHTLPANISTALLNNGGGYMNHVLFFNQLRPGHATQADGMRFLESSQLGVLLINTFGSRAVFEKTLSDACMKVFGSGWCWLQLCGSAAVVSWRPNQESPWQHSCTPLLGIDVWEHAYYLKHANKRAAYVATMLQAINWDVVEQLFVSALSSMPSTVKEELLERIQARKEL